MPVVENPNRFSLPAEAFITQVLQESYPALNLAPGSAIYDLFVTPAALIVQQLRDRSKVVSRNQGLLNYQTMLPEELDRLASNFFVSRRPGTHSTGVQRVVFSTPQVVNITPNAAFTNDDGIRFRPITSVTVSSSALSSNVIVETGEYFVDVACISESTGDQTELAAGAVTGFSGVPGAARTINSTDYVGGQNSESNSRLFSRIKSSLSNKDLVTSSSFKAAILETFTTVRAIKVVGFGDPLMERDVVSVSLAAERLFEQSFCQKVNLPLDASGNVQWEDDNGAVITAPIGGFVGAIYDLTGKDFNAIQASLDGRNVEIISVQPNFRVRLLNSEDPDFVNNDFVVTRVEEVPVAPGGPAVKLVRLDRSLQDTSSVDVSAALDTNPYTILGAINSSHFHVGGKVDIYIDSVSDTTKTVNISVLPPLSSSAPTASEVPLTSSFVNEVSGASLFEDGAGFEIPVLAVTKVELVDPSNDNFILQELTPNVHYNLVRKESRGKFTRTEDDVLVIRGSEVAPETGDEIPLFVGGRIKVTYTTNPDIPTIQSFLDAEDNRDITKDVRVLAPDIVILDVGMSYRGALSQSAIVDILSEYIKEKSFGAEITVNEIVTVLAFFGVTDIIMPVTLRSRISSSSGTVSFEESTDRLALKDNQVLTSDTDLSITKLS
jgi:hypothetical protein